MNRRLLKDLPIGNLMAGMVIMKAGRGHGGRYSVTLPTLYYDMGGNSGGGFKTFTEREEELIDVIWDHKDWFEPADLKHIDVIANSNSILLRFDPIDQVDAEDLAKGIIHILPHLKDGNYVWNAFDNIFAQMRSR